MFDNFVLQLDVTLKGRLGTVVALATGIRAGQTLENVAVAAAMQFLTVFGLAAFYSCHLFEQF